MQKLIHKIFTVLVISVQYMTFPASLVMVYDGACTPSVLEKSLEQIRVFNPDLAVHVIIPQNVFGEISETTAKYNVHLHCQETLDKQFLHSHYIQGRGDFGSQTAKNERFFYVYDLAQKFDLQDVFYIETNVSLYFNIKNHVDAFRSYDNIAVPFVDDAMCCMSFCYFRSKQSLEMLCDVLCEFMMFPYSDIIITRLLNNRLGSWGVGYLPILSYNYVSNNVLKCQFNCKVKNKKNFCRNYLKFNSVFDNGQMIKNIKEKKTGVFDGNRFNLVWKKDDRGREIPFLQCGNEEIKVGMLCMFA